MSQNLVVKSNQLVEASYQLSLNEQRVILTAITQVDRKFELKSDDVFTIYARDFARQFDLRIDGAYSELIKVADRLFDRHVIINQPDPNNVKIQKTKTRWISSISYVPDDGALRIKFAQDIIPFLTLLESQFTKYRLDAISRLTSTYAIRLYELLVQWGSVGKREVELQWLKDQFEIGDKYNTIFNLKSRVIDVAVEQINKYSDLSVTYDQRKAGRVVTHLIFSFDIKADADKPREAEVEQANKKPAKAAQISAQSAAANPDKNPAHEKALAIFEALPAAEQEELRAAFAATLQAPLKSVWKKAKNQPEAKPMFTSQFVSFLELQGFGGE